MKQMYRYPIEHSLIEDMNIDVTRTTLKERALKDFLKEYAITDTNKIEIKEAINFESQVNRYYYIITIITEDLGIVEIHQTKRGE